MYVYIYIYIGIFGIIKYLSVSQRQAIIKLIEKSKDKKFIKNYIKTISNPFLYQTLTIK